MERTRCGGDLATERSGCGGRRGEDAVRRRPGDGEERMRRSGGLAAVWLHGGGGLAAERSGSKRDDELTNLILFMDQLPLYPYLIKILCSRKKNKGFCAWMADII